MTLDEPPGPKRYQFIAQSWRMENINSWLTIPNDLSLTIKLTNFYSISTQIIPVSGRKGQVSRSVWGTGHRLIQRPPKVTGICSAFFESHGNFSRKCGYNAYESLSPLTQEKRAVFSCVIRLFRNEKGILLEKKFDPRLFLGLLLGSHRSTIGQSFSLSLVTIPELFAKVNSTEFPCSFVSPV